MVNLVVLAALVQLSLGATPEADSFSVRPKSKGQGVPLEMLPGSAERLPQGTLSKLGKPHHSINAVCLSPDASKIAVGEAKAVRVVETRTQKHLFNFKLDEGFSASEVIFSPDSRLLVAHIKKKQPPQGGGGGALSGGMYMGVGGLGTTGSDPDERLLVWNADTGELIREFKESYLSSPRFTKKSTILSFNQGWSNGWLCQWNTATGEVTSESSGRRAVFGDGAIVAVANGNGMLDLRRGDEKLLRLQADEFNFVFSPDGKLLASASCDQIPESSLLTNEYKRSAGTIRIWDLATGKQRWQARVSWLVYERFSELAFSPDGKLLISNCWDEVPRPFSKWDEKQRWAMKIQVWDVATGMERWQAQVRAEGRSARLGEFAFSMDGKLLACWENDDNGQEEPRCGRVRVWDLASGKECWHASRNETVAKLEFSPDSRVLAATWGQQLTLWDARTGRERHTFSGTLYVFTPDGKRLLFCHDTVCEWDIAENRETHKWTGEMGDVDRLALSADAGLLVCWGSLSLSVWDAGKRRMLTSPDVHGGAIEKLQFSQNGRWLLSKDQLGYTGVWDLKWCGGLVSQPHLRLAGWDATFSADGKLVSCVTDRGLVRVWDLEKTQLVHKFTVPIDGDWTMMLSVFDPQGKLVAVPQKKTITIWDLSGGKQLVCLQGGGAIKGVMQFSPNGKIFAYRAVDGGLRLWDLAAGKQILGSNDVPTRMAFSADSELFAWSSPKTIHVCELSSARELHTFTGHTDEVHSLTFSRDGRGLASTGRDRTLRFWDLKTGKESQKVEVDDTYYEIWPSASGISVAKSGRSSLYEGETGRLIAQIEAEMATADLWCDPRPTVGFALSPDGRLLAGGTERVRVMELATGRTFPPFQGLKQDGISALAFSPDCRFLASGGRDGTIALWDWREAVGARAASKALGRLSTQELRNCWAALAAPEPLQAYRAIDMLSAAPADALLFLKQQLRPAANKRYKRARQFLQQLKQGGPADRQRAGEALETMGAEVQPLLREALAGQMSADARAAIEKLLSSPGAGQWSAGTLRGIRAVQVLEQIAGAEAAALLESLAGRYSQSVQTQEAKAALSRLRRTQSASK